MINGKKIIAVLPAYNAEKTLQMTVSAIPRNIVDDIILVDDASKDGTVAEAKRLGIKTFVHERNLGYGGNQKTCYREAQRAGADIVVMVHPDFQYDPVFIPQMLQPIAEGKADAVFGSRMFYPMNAIFGGMPYWKFIANVSLTKLENLVFGTRLSECHSGFRAYSRKVLEDLPLHENSNDFVFDAEIIAQLSLAKMKIVEIPISTKYFPEASMIGFGRSVRYGLDVLDVLKKYLLFKLKIRSYRQFSGIK